MATLRIQGPVRLAGTVTVAGAKNATLPLLAAALLCDEPYVLENVPWVTDVSVMIRLLAACGGRARWTASRSLQVIPPEGQLTSPADVAGASSIRASFCLLGPLLARHGEAVLPLPGGCRIGPRPVDRHLEAMRRLGAEVTVRDGIVYARAPRLHGNLIHLATHRGPTVTGTCNAMLAAVGARGETVLYGAAREPEVVTLGRFLQACGVVISGLGTPTIVVKGARLPLRPPTRFRIIPDRIEAATWLCAAAATGGKIVLRHVEPRHLQAPLALLRRIGCAINVTDATIALIAPQRPVRAFLAVAEPYPGIATDVQAQLTALATAANGESTVRDTVFPERFQHVPQLQAMGASIRRLAGQCVISGPTQLRGARVKAVDLRASAALVIAALLAEGETEIMGLEQLRRGYDELPRKLAALGVAVEVDDDELLRPAA